MNLFVKILKSVNIFFVIKLFVKFLIAIICYICNFSIKKTNRILHTNVSVISFQIGYTLSELITEIGKYE